MLEGPVFLDHRIDTYVYGQPIAFHLKERSVCPSGSKVTKPIYLFYRFSFCVAAAAAACLYTDDLICDVSLACKFFYGDINFGTFSLF